jgi:NTP pyrophosphatase (non-canonical NTP hydrolase)
MNNADAPRSHDIAGTSLNSRNSTNMTDSLRDLAQQLGRFAQERDWEQFHSPKNLASALVVEAAELLEHFQWLTESQSRELAPEKRDAVGAEIADVLLYLVQLSTVLNIDPIEAAQAKLRLNERRYPVDLARGNSKKHDEL